MKFMFIEINSPKYEFVFKGINSPHKRHENFASFLGFNIENLDR